MHTRPNEHKELVKKIEELIQQNKNRKSRNSISDKTNQDRKNYLEFLTFCLKENFSFLQISALGKFLKTMSLNQKLDFLNNHHFEIEELSKFANAMGNPISREIINDLAENPFSLSIDNVTVSGTGICGLQVRYCKRYEDENGMSRSKIENKLIGIKYLEESRNPTVLLDAIEKKILDLNLCTINNLYGITHDRTSEFVGSYVGLDKLLK